MTDCEIILQILSDFKWHNVIEIMQRAKPGCINFACRSRISDLKKKGYQIESEIDTNGQARYRLLMSAEIYKTEDNGQICFL